MQKTLPAVLLLADDNEFNRAVVQRLTDRGFICHLECDGDLALQDLRDKSWSLVLIDFETRFQRWSAIDMAREIRKVRVSKPEIALVSENPQTSLFESHQVGACGVIRKPLRIEDVVALLESQGFDLSDATPNLTRRFTTEAIRKKLSRFERSHHQAMQVKTQVSNLGRGGFYLPIPTGAKVPEVGQLVEFDIKMGMVPETRFRGQGIVSWVQNHEGQIGVGIEFLALPTEGEVFVDAFSELFKVSQFVPNN